MIGIQDKSSEVDFSNAVQAPPEDIQELYDLIPEGMFENQEDLMALINSDGLGSVYDLIPEGMFENQEEFLATFDVLKKKEEPIYPSPGEDLVSDSELVPTTTDSLDIPQVPTRNGVRVNPDGTESTHLMAAEQLEDGTWVGFPRLFQDADGTWVDMTEGNWEDAYQEALSRGEVKEFGTDKDTALAYGEGSWKPLEVEEFTIDGKVVTQEESESYNADPFADTLLADNYGDDEFEKSLKSSVTSDMIEEPEEFVVPEMDYKFGQYGFTFEKEDWMGDEMRVTADNGKQLQVELDRWFWEEETAKELEDFLRANKVEANIIKARSTAIIKDQKIIQDEEQVIETVRVFNEETENLEKQIQEYATFKTILDADYKEKFTNLTEEQLADDPVLSEDYKAWEDAKVKEEELLKEIEGKSKAFIVKGRELDGMAGKYVEMQRKQGAYSGGIWNAVLDGTARFGASAIDNAVDIGTYGFTDDLMRDSLKEDPEGWYKKEIIRAAREQGNIPKDYQGEGVLESLSKDELTEALGGDSNDMKWVVNGLAKLALATTFMGGAEALREEGPIYSDTPFDSAHSKVMDNVRKAYKYEDGKTLEDAYKKVVKGKYRNPLSSVAANTDLTDGALDQTRRGLRLMIGDDSVSEAWSKAEQETFWGGSILGLSESLPAMLGGAGAVGWAQRTAQMYAQVSDHVMEEMENNPEFDNISENEKAMVKIPIGIAVGTLEVMGYRNVINQKGFLNNLVGKALGRYANKSTELVGSRNFAQFIRQDVETMVARGVLTIGAGGAAEFETGFAQEIAEIGIKDIYNAVKEDKKFQTPETWGAWISQVMRAGAQEAIGGFIMSVPSAVSNSLSNQDMQSLNNTVFEVFENMSKDPNLNTMYVTALKLRISNPKNDTDAKSAQEELTIVNQLRGILESGAIPDTYSVEQKKEILQLLYNKNQLENELEVEDNALSKRKQELLNKINNRLEGITNQTISEQQDNEIDASKIQDFEDGKTKTTTEIKVDDDVTTEEQADIEELFKDEITEDNKGVPVNIRINRNNAPELNNSQNSIKNNIIRIANLGAKSISKILPEVRMVLHESNEEYLKYATRGHARGEYDPVNKIIHINLTDAKNSTIPHEIFHAVLIEKIVSDPAIARATETMMRSVRKSLANDSDLAKRIDEFAAKYVKEDKDGNPILDKDGKTIASELQNEERLAELIGILSSEAGRSLSKPTKNIIIQWVKDLARRFGIKIGSDFGKNDSDVIDLLNTIARKTKTGEELEESDIETLKKLEDQEQGTKEKTNTTRNQLTDKESENISKSVVDKTVKGKPIPTLLQFKKKNGEEILYFEGEINQKNVRDNIPQSYNTTAAKLIQYNNFGIDKKGFLESSLENASKKDINKKLADNKKVLNKKIISLKKEIVKIKAGKKLTKSEKEPLIGQRVKSIKIIKDIKRSNNLLDQLNLVETIPQLTYSNAIYNSIFYNLGDGLKKLSTQELLKRSDEVYKKAKDIVKSNLLSVYNSVDPSIRKISKLWYDGANLIAQEMSSKYNVTLEQAAAIIATQSPQMPWFDNLHLADVIMDTMKNRANSVFTKEMFDYYISKAVEYPKQKAYIPTLKKEIGKKLSELSNYNASIFVRVDYDLNISRKAPIRIPTGTAVKDSQKGDSSFSGYDVIAKGVSVYRDGSMDNISNQLGRANKVRNFYLNIADPSNSRAVTIDTHAMAIALFKPLASNDIEVDFNAPSFAFYADAYRELAKELGIEARALQSITWEAARAIFPAIQKAKSGYKNTISKIWDGFKSGENTIEQVQKEIFNQAENPNITEWSMHINILKNETKRKNVSGRIIRSDGIENTNNVGDVSISDSGISGTRGGLNTSDSKSSIKSRQQIVGEQSDLTENERGHLEVAKNMEIANQDPLKIKIETGWERGVDNKWKYEIVDGKLKPDLVISSLPTNVSGEYYTKLSDVIDAPELFEKYNTPVTLKKQMLEPDGSVWEGAKSDSRFPAIKDIKVLFVPRKDSAGSFDSFTKVIEIKFPMSKKETWLTVLHEVQHFIQHREGFAIGGNETTTLLTDIASSKDLEKLYGRLESVEAKRFLREQIDIHTKYKKIRAKIKDLKDQWSNLSFKNDSDSYKKQKELGSRLTLLQTRQNATNILMVEQIKDELIKIDPLVNFGIYEILAGENEATNVEHRADWSSIRRRNTLLSQTEKTNQKDQVVVTEPLTRQQKSINEIINESREMNFREPVIRDLLVRNLKFPVKEVDKLMVLNVDMLQEMPKSFGAIQGGATVGIKLFKKIEAFRGKITKANYKKKIANQISEQDIVDQTIEFLQKQPEYINESDTYTQGNLKKGTQVIKNVKALSVQQAKMVIDLQSSIGIRPTEDMASKLRKARVMLRQNTKGKRDLKKIKSEVRKFIRKSLPKSIYTKPQVIRLINNLAIADETNIENILKDVTEFVIEQNVKDLQKKLENILNGKFQKDQSGRKSANRVDNDTRKRIERIKKLILGKDATNQQVIDANKALLEEFENLSKETEQTNENRKKMVDIQLIMEYNKTLTMDNSNSNKVTQLDSVVASLQEILDYGRSMLKQELLDSFLEYQRQFELGYEAITGNKIDMTNQEDAKKELDNSQYERDNDAERSKLKGRLKNAWDKIQVLLSEGVFGTAEALDGLMHRIDVLPGEMFGGVLQEMFTNEVDEASRKFKGRRMLVESVIQNKLIELYSKKWKKESRKNRVSFDTGVFVNDEMRSKNKGIILSQNEIGYLYNKYKDPAEFNSFSKKYAVEVINKDDSASEKERKKTINDANAKRVMKELTSKLDSKVKELADWQVDELYPSLYEHYNDTYKKIYRTDLDWNQYYSGKAYREGIEADPLDMLSKSNAYIQSGGPGSIKSTVNNNIPVKAMDMVDVMATYVNEMEYFAAYAVPLRDMNKFFTNKHISSAIKTIHGKNTYAFIENMIKKLSENGISNGILDNIVNSMNTAFILSSLAVSPVVMIKQLTSFITYANDIGFVNYIKYAMKNKTQQIEIFKEVRDNSVYMQDRKNNSILRAIETYSEESMKEFVPKPAKEWIVNFMMWTTKFGDRTAIMVGGLPNYSFYKADFKKKNPTATEQESIEYAIRLFERDTKRTQQSGDLQDKDLLQTKNPIFRALNMFLTTPKQYLRKEIYASRNLYRKIKSWDRKAGKGTIWENVRQLLLFHTVMPMFFQYVAMGMPGILRGFRDDDDEDLLRAAVIGNLNALFIIGEILAGVGDVLTGKPWAGQGSKQVGILAIANSLTRKWKKVEQTKDPVKKAKYKQEFFIELTKVSGAPGPTIMRFIDNYSEIGSDGDMGRDILRILNYSKYQQVGPKSKKKTKATKTTAEANAEYLKKQIKKERAKTKKQSNFLSGGFDKGFGKGFNNKGFN